MGRFVLILVGGAAILGALSLASGAGTSAQRAVVTVAGYAERSIAREIALTGHNAATTSVQALTIAGGSYSGPSRFKGQYQQGTYTSDVEQSGDTLRIVTRSRYHGSQYVVRATFHRAQLLLPPSQIPPPYMLAAMYSGGNITVEHRLTVSALAGTNADLHANGSMIFNGSSNPSLVQGFGRYGGGISMQAGQSTAQVFVPPINPNLLPTAGQTGVISPPTIIASNYEAVATKKSYSTVSLAGIVPLGTEANPEIWYVDGNMRTSGPVVFQGYGAIVIRGNLLFRHATVMSDLIASGVVFFVEGNIAIEQGNLALSGHLMTNGNFEVDRPTIINGGITVGGNVTVKQPLTINHQLPECVIIDPIYPGQCTQETPPSPGVGDGWTLAGFSEGG